MCKFSMKFWTSQNDFVYQTYDVLSFEGETDYAWLFEVKAIKRIQNQTTRNLNGSPFMMAFPKKEKVGEQGTRPIFKYLDPPKFYNKLKNKAINEGKLRVQGDEAPPLGKARLI